MAQSAERRPHTPKGAKTPGQEKPRHNWFLRVVGKGNPLPDFKIKSSDELPNPYAPVEFKDTSDLRSRLDAMRIPTSEPVIDYTTDQQTVESADNASRTYRETGLTHKDTKGMGAVKKIVIVSTATTAVVGGAALAYEATSDSDSSDAKVTIGEKVDSTPPQLTTPDGKQIVIPSVSETPATTAATTSSTETAKPTNTPTPEVKSNVPCVVLPQEYCDSAEVLERVNNGNVDLKLLAFKLPAGVPIYALADGDLIKGTGVNGVLLTIKNLGNNSPDAVSYGVQGDIKPSEDVVTRKVKKGDVIGYTQDTGVKLPIPGDYKIVINSMDSTFKDKSENLKEFFPAAFKKGATGQFTINSSAPAAITPTFLPPKYGN